MSTSSSSDTNESLFRPWDTSENYNDDKKVTIKTQINTPHSVKNLCNNNRKVKSEPEVKSSSVSGPTLSMSPLAIAMRGLVPDACLPGHVIKDTCLPTHVSHVSQLMQFRAVHHHLHDLQLAAGKIQDLHLAAASDKKIRPKKYKCDQCSASFSNNGQLRGHVRIHTGTLPFPMI